MFKEAILKSIESGETRGNIITDGTYTCTYQELPGIFKVFDDFFVEAGVSPGDCNILRCGNSLPEGLLLLWMLYRERDFVLLPRMAVDKKEQIEIERSRLPEFCKHIVSMNVDVDSVTLDLKNPNSYINYQKFFGGPGGDFSKKPPGRRRHRGHVFLRTSGSTAEPKLVMHTNEKLTGNALNCARRLELEPIDRIIIPVPLFHMYGLGAGFLPGVMVGASVALVGNTNVIKYLDREKQFQPNVSFMTPPLCEMLLRTRKKPYHYRLVVTAGDRIGQSAFEDFETKFGKLINLYGSTELGVIATSRLSDPVDMRCRGIIQPLPGVDVSLEDRHEDAGMAEIICRHDYGLDAYVDKQGKIISRAEEIARFRTRDLGKRYENNTFKVVGRTGNSINRQGILVAFSEVESIMEQGIEDIAHVVVLSKEDGEKSYRGKRLLACCQLKPGAELDARDIRSRCFDMMMRHMVPDEVIIKEIPRLPNGKFDRKKLEKNEGGK